MDAKTQKKWANWLWTFCSDDQTRPAICGPWRKCGHWVATNGHRLAVVPDLGEVEDLPDDVVIPANVLTAFAATGKRLRYADKRLWAGEESVRIEQATPPDMTIMFNAAIHDIEWTNRLEMSADELKYAIDCLSDVEDWTATERASWAKLPRLGIVKKETLVYLCVAKRPGDADLPYFAVRVTCRVKVPVEEADGLQRHQTKEVVRYWYCDSERFTPPDDRVCTIDATYLGDTLGKHSVVQFRDKLSITLVTTGDAFHLVMPRRD